MFFFPPLFYSIQACRLDVLVPRDISEEYFRLWIFQLQHVPQQLVLMFPLGPAASDVDKGWLCTLRQLTGFVQAVMRLVHVVEDEGDAQLWVLNHVLQELLVHDRRDLVKHVQPVVQTLGRKVSIEDHQTAVDVALPRKRSRVVVRGHEAQPERGVAGPPLRKLAVVLRRDKGVVMAQKGS